MALLQLFYTAVDSLDRPLNLRGISLSLAANIDRDLLYFSEVV
jgi:hypothetical protein